MGYYTISIFTGHEVISKVSEIENMVKHLKIGQYVGLGWRSRSCSICDQCLIGYQNRCLNGEPVIVGRHGGFANNVRCKAIWTFPLLSNLNIKTASPFLGRYYGF